VLCCKLSFPPFFPFNVEIERRDDWSPLPFSSPGMFNASHPYPYGNCLSFRKSHPDKSTTTPTISICSSLIKQHDVSTSRSFKGVAKILFPLPLVDFRSPSPRPGGLLLFANCCGWDRFPLLSFSHRRVSNSSFFFSPVRRVKKFLAFPVSEANSLE